MLETGRCPYCLERKDEFIEYNGMCVDCASARLRRFDDYTERLAACASDFFNLLREQQGDHACVTLAMEHQIDLADLLRPTIGWWHYNAEQVLMMYAREEISEGAACGLLGMHRVEFRVFREKHGVEGNWK